MKKTTELGMNRTGMDMSPIDGQQLLKDVKKLTPLTRPDSHTMASIETQYIQEADTIGSVPIPATPRGLLKSGAEKFKGRNPEVLVNKLGERLAFERAGVRFYESVIRKCKAAGKDTQVTGPVSLAELKHFRDEEAEHFTMLKEAMEALGADPTAQTPDADVSGVAAMGIQRVLNDPRTSMAHCLEMLLTLELTDNACWELLIKLAQEFGQDEMVERFQLALNQEQAHLKTVRTWYEKMTLTEATKKAG